MYILKKTWFSHISLFCRNFHTKTIKDNGIPTRAIDRAYHSQSLYQIFSFLRLISNEIQQNQIMQIYTYHDFHTSWHRFHTKMTADLAVLKYSAKISCRTLSVYQFSALYPLYLKKYIEFKLCSVSWNRDFHTSSRRFHTTPTNGLAT